MPHYYNISDKVEDLAAYRFLRLKHILHPVGPIPISKSSWWKGVAEGRYPQPVKLGPRTTVWRAEEIRAFIAAQSSRD